VVSVGPIFALSGVTTSLAAVYVRTGPDDFVDISIVFMDTGGAPGGAPFDGRLWVRTAPFIELCCGIILSGDGGHADGQQDEGEDALHDDELL